MGPLKKTRCEVKNEGRKTVEDSLVHVFIHLQNVNKPKKSIQPSGLEVCIAGNTLLPGLFDTPCKNKK